METKTTNTTTDTTTDTDAYTHALSWLDQKEEESQKGDSKNKVSISFLPEGNHTGRLFVDPNGELCREISLFRINGMWVQPMDGKNDMIQAVINESFSEEWKYSLNTYGLAYFALISTSNEGEYWSPSKKKVSAKINGKDCSYTVYCVIGKRRFINAISGYLNKIKGYGKEHVLSLLNPNQDCSLLNLEHSKGSQGNTIVHSLMPTLKAPAITLGAWYQPLSNLWVPSESNMDEYAKALAFLKEEASRSKLVVSGMSSESLSSPSLQSSSNVVTSKPLTTSTHREGAASQLPNLPPEIVGDSRGIRPTCYGQIDMKVPTCAFCAFNAECLSVTSS